MKKNEIPVKNYVILVIITLVTVFATFQLANRYNEENDYYQNKSPLNTVLYEVKVEELDDYLLDNPNMVVYIVNGNDENILEVDKSIKEFVLKNDLSKEIVVINATKNQSLVTSKLSKMLSNDLVKYKNNLLSETNFIVINDRIIEDILMPKTVDEELLKSFFVKNGVM